MTTEDPARSELLLDTHALLWLLRGSPSMGMAARGAIHLAEQRHCVLISAITPWEIALLVSKNRLKLDGDVMDWVRNALAKPGVRLAPLAPEIAVGSNQLPFEMHSDPADRILVATARHLGASLVTADRALLELAKSGHFRAIDAAV